MTFRGALRCESRRNELTVDLRTPNSDVKTTAAVLVQTGRPLELAELEVPALKAGQVLVEIACSGVCHTQLLECRGERGEDPYLPHCLGHEASGTVLDAGRGVTKCRPGERVILSWIKGRGADVPGTIYDWNGRAVNAGGVTTFSRHAVVSENRVSALPAEIDLRDAALIGCAVATGAGAVFNTAKLAGGNSVAVFGAGGIGLCAVLAAATVGAKPVIAVDVNPARLQAAAALGATHSFDAAAVDPVEAIRELLPQGVDVAIEASGRPDVMRLALAAVRPRGGTAVVIGNARHGERLEIDPRELNQGKRLLGTWGGDSDPDRDFPRYCKLIAEGRFRLEQLRGDLFPLSDINAALQALETGRAVRPLIDMSPG